MLGCDLGLTVIIKGTAHEFRCTLPAEHDGYHQTPVGSEWRQNPSRMTRIKTTETVEVADGRL